MNHEPRVKFSVAIDQSGDFVYGDAAAGFRVVQGYEPFAYLLENADGGYELGLYRPNNPSGMRRTPVYEYSTSVAQNGTGGLTCTLVAAPVAFANASGGKYQGFPSPPQNNMLDSVAVGPGAQTNNSAIVDCRMGSAFGANAAAWSQKATAIGGDSIAKRNGTAIGYGAKATQDAEIQLGNSGNSHHSYLPVRANNSGDTIGTFPLFAVEDYQVLEQIDHLRPLEVQRADIRVQGTIAVMNDADAQATRKVFNLDYMYAYPYGQGAVLLYQNITTLYAGASAVNVSITLNASTKLPEIAVASVLGSMNCQGLLTVTKIVW